MPIVLICVVAGAVIALGVALHHLAIHAERRGWIYYRTRPSFRGSTLGYLEEIYNPAMHHVTEERDHERGGASQEESGDGPEAGTR